MIHTINHHTAYSYSKFTCQNPNIVKIKLKKTFGIDNLDQENKKLAQIKTLALKQEADEEQNFFLAKPLLSWRSDLAFFNLRYYFLNCFKALHLCWKLSRNNKRIAFVGANGNLLDVADLASYGDDFKKKTHTRDIVPRLVKKRPQSQKFTKRPKYKEVGTEYNRLKTKKTAQKQTMLFSGSLSRYLQTFFQASSIENPSDSFKQRGASNIGKMQTWDQFCLQGKINHALARRAALLYNDTSTGFFSNSALCSPLLWNPFLALATKRVNHIGDSTERVFGFQLYNLNRPLDGIVPYLAKPYVLKKSYKNSKNLFKRTHKKNTNFLILPSYRNLCVQALFQMCFGPSFAKKQPKQTKQTKQSQGFRVKQKQGFKFLLTQKSQNNYLKPKAYQQGIFKLKPKPNEVKGFNGKTKNSVIKSSKNQQGLKVVPGIIYSRHWYKNYLASNKGLSLKKKPKYYANFLRFSYGHDFKKFATNSNLKQADAIFFTNDKNTALSSQARRLRCATIGIVSGIKTHHGLKQKQHNLQKDSVDYPILGNPKNSFFVFMILRMFLNVIDRK